ncbi:MAG: hypothetical protein JOS17DRAFT_731970 [Linnemannia elongata]|nr:MAG: hypothetical protein JOS17DRAFT_731970 [Linnemannia elongata]
MGKKQFIDRKNARHFHLVHRSQRDPLSRDESAPQRVLKEVIPANLIGKVAIPQEEFDGEYSDGEGDIFGEHGTEDGINYGTYDREIEAVELLEAPVAASKKKKSAAKNEEKIGEAAMLGLVGDDYNDGTYDYSQHFKEIGTSSEGVYMAAPKVAAQQKKAAQQSRGIQFTDADAADEMAREDVGTAAGKKKGKIQLPSGVLPSREELDFADVYQSAVPMGLQPDMPFDIRQTLEALEDEEFVDGDLDESFFDQLDEDGEFEDEEVEEYNEDEDEDGEGDRQGWEADFKKFKKAQQYHSDDDSFEGSDDGHSQASRSSRRPAGASASTFSMSSSAMFRNENLTLLDERFDKIEREYESDSDDDEDEGTDFKGEELRKDFDSILDDFLDKFEIVGSKMVPRLEGVTSENKLSTIRNALLVDEGEEERSVATTVGGTRRPKKNLDDDMATELQTDFRSRAERMRDNWDVQTILSTYSNLDNHPGMIKEQTRRRIHIDPKTGMPVVTEKLSKKALQRQAEMAAAAEAAAKAENGGASDDEFDDDEDFEEEAENLGVKRNKAETKEEKKARKEAIKQEKKNRRETKKATKTAFANEKSRQEKVMKNLKKGQGVTHLD